MTVVSAEPFSLLFGFRIVHPRPGDAPTPEELLPFAENGRIAISTTDGSAWLSFPNAEGAPSKVIADVVALFAEALADAALTPPPGCLLCGSTEGAVVTCIENRCTRICPPCVDRALEDHRRMEAELNRPTLRNAILLPLSALLLSGGWGMMWFSLNEFIRWNAKQVILIDKISVAIIAVIAGAMAYPMGVLLRKSGAVNRFPAATSVLTAVAACVVGEIFFIALLMKRIAGVFDFETATELFIPLFKDYGPAWIFFKLVVAGTAATACYIAASQTKSAPLQI
jgi:hypothetical protein